MNLEMWTNVGLGLGAIVGGFGLYIGKKRGDGTPPPDRPPPAQELMKSMERFREEVLQSVDDADDRNRNRHYELIKMLDQLRWELRSEKVLQDIKAAYPVKHKDT